MLKALYVNNRFFFLLFFVGVSYVLSFFFKGLLAFSHVFMLLTIITFIVDGMFLFNTRRGIEAQRFLPEKLSNGDENQVNIIIKNNYFYKIEAQIIDEIPFQFQKRDFSIKKEIKSREIISFQYILVPKERGEYSFGRLNIFVSSPIGLVSKRFSFQEGESLPCYPSFIHLRKYELMALQNEFSSFGYHGV